MENEELIRRRMGETREALADKLETLEQKVAQSVSAVSETVANVQEKVSESVESVKEAVDVRLQTDRHPWLMLGGSVLCGFVLGKLLQGENDRPAPHRFTLTPTMPASEQPSANGRSHQAETKTGENGHHWLRQFEPELQHLKGLALGVTLGTVREMLTAQVPPHMADQLREIIDAVTQKAGGEPVPSSDFTAIKPAAAAGEPCAVE